MAGIYLHIPFCKRRCIYCDFFSTTQSGKKDAYIQALCKELMNRRDYLEGERIETVYFGGGTPSQLEHKDFEVVFDTIHKWFEVAPDAEITVEANPDDLSMEYLKELRMLPFNRLSMGIQTFNDATLKLLHRRHTASEAIDAFKRCRKVGFDNISIDLIYGLPGETMEGWNCDLQQAIDLHPEHISAYHLIYEEGTALWKLREQHRVKEVNEDLSVSFFEQLIHRLKSAGYQHYEISNFCLPGYHSRHNSSYWEGKRYLGCGPSAHSFNLTSRQWNIASLDRYIAGINQEEKVSAVGVSKEDVSKEDVYEVEELDLYTRYNERIITNIRTARGMSLMQLEGEFGEDLYAYCLKLARPHIQAGTLEVKDGFLKLTEKGIFTSDGIMSDLLWVD